MKQYFIIRYQPKNQKYWSKVAYFGTFEGAKRYANTYLKEVNAVEIITV